MSKRQNRHPFSRIAIDIAGFGLVIASPFLGWLPGPGGIPVFLLGLGILARNYDWAENLLKDFEKKRLDFVDKYLVGNKRVAWTIDLLCIGIIALAIFVYLNLSNSILKLATLGAGSFALFIMISNQKRLDRGYAKLKKALKLK